MKCIEEDKDFNCAGDLVPYVLEQGVFYRCSKHALRNMLNMSQWGEYTIPTVRKETITDEEVASFIHQMEELDLKETY